MSKAILVLLLALMNGSVFAGVVIQADDATLQPLIDRDEVGFKSCGVRGLVLKVVNDTFEAHDFSLMIRADMPYGTLKAGKVKRAINVIKGREHLMETVVPPPVKFWIAIESEGKGINPIKIFPAENKGFILELADFVDTYKVMMAMLDGERMQFVIRYKNQPIDEVVSFSAKMTEKELKPLLQCINDVGERLSKPADMETK